MAPVPDRPKIYHITHESNLAEILRWGVLWSDAKRIALGLECQVVGLSGIKQRRLERLPVRCHPGTLVGDYVPFYFCPRSVMLYILHMANHPELTYRGGQAPIVHLVADLKDTAAWAQADRRRWAFSDRNAGAAYASFFARLEDLQRIDWAAVDATDWRDAIVKENKQAEFLVYESFPWGLVEGIGVRDASVAERVRGTLSGATHIPPVTVERAWYY
jgi:hypothetical protein